MKNFNSEAGWKKWATVKNIVTGKLIWKILSRKIVQNQKTNKKCGIGKVEMKNFNSETGWKILIQKPDEKN